jgi:hypothetical protein
MARATRRQPLYFRARIRARHSPNRRALSLDDVIAWCAAHAATDVLATATTALARDRLGTLHTGPCYAVAGPTVQCSPTLAAAAPHLCHNCGLALLRHEPFLTTATRLINYEAQATSKITTTDPTQLTELIHQCLIATERLDSVVAYYPPLHSLAPVLTEQIIAHRAALLARLRSPLVSPLITHPRTHLLAVDRLRTRSDTYRTALLTFATHAEPAALWQNRPQVAAVPHAVANRLSFATMSDPPAKRLVTELRPLLPSDDPTQLAELLSAIWQPGTMTFDDALAAARPCLTVQPSPCA